MRRVPEKWRELAHAEIDGAVIQFADQDGDWFAKPNHDWPDGIEFRIDPKCDYALAKIPENHREVYLQWCDGAEIEGMLHKSITQELWIVLNESTVKDMGDIWKEEYEIRVWRKPKTVKRWQWRAQFHACGSSLHMVTESYWSEEEMAEIQTRGWISKFTKIEETMREDEV